MGKYKEVILVEELKKKQPLKTLRYKLITLDIETYKDEKSGELVPYLIGFLAFEGSYPDYQIFYLKDYDTPEAMLKACLDTLLTKKYDNATVYAHNLIKFDSKILLATICNYYELEFVSGSGKVLGYHVKRGGVKITFKDSYLILPHPLRKLAVSAGLDYGKGIFPHKYVNIRRIRTPEKERDEEGRLPFPKKKDFYNISEKEYEIFVNSLTEFNLEIQATRYLKQDLLVLWDCLKEFAGGIFRSDGVNLFKHYTISGLSLQLFRVKFMSDASVPNLPVEINNTLRPGYKGGVVNVFIPRGEDLFCYDVNSLYPYVMRGDFPTGNLTYTYYKEPREDVKGMNGMVYAEVSCERDYKFPFLSMYSEDDTLIQPTGTWKHIYTTEEIEYAIQLGYRVKIFLS